MRYDLAQLSICENASRNAEVQGAGDFSVATIVFVKGAGECAVGGAEVYDVSM